MPGMEKSIRVRILEREFGLRIHHENEEETRQIATFVDARMRAFRRAHPEQPELTAAIITALTIAEELVTLRAHHDEHLDDLESTLSALSDDLDAVLAQAPLPPSNDAPDPDSPES